MNWNDWQGWEWKKSWLPLRPGFLTFMKCCCPNMPSISYQTTGARGILEIAQWFSSKPLPSCKCPCSSPTFLTISQRPSKRRGLGRDYKLEARDMSLHQRRNGLCLRWDSSVFGAEVWCARTGRDHQEKLLYEDTESQRDEATCTRLPSQVAAKPRLPPASPDSQPQPPCHCLPNYMGFQNH